MQYFKLSLLLIILSAFNSFAFDMKSCLNKNFELEISHSGKLFGIVQNKLNIEKNNCVITISHKKVFTNTWIIDVCRSPVHIKQQGSGITILKRDSMPCYEAGKNQDASKFCSAFDKIMIALQDDGLIFADGEKEKLDDPHGQTFCSHELIDAYLRHGKIFSRYEESEDIVKDINNSSAISSEENQSTLKSIHSGQ